MANPKHPRTSAPPAPAPRPGTSRPSAPPKPRTPPPVQAPPAPELPDTWQCYSEEERQDKLALDLPYAQAIGIQMDEETGLVAPGFYFNQPIPVIAPDQGVAVSSAGTVYEDGHPFTGQLWLSVLGSRTSWRDDPDTGRRKSSNQLLCLFWPASSAAGEGEPVLGFLTAPGVKGESLREIERWGRLYATDVAMRTHGKARPPACFFRFPVRVGKLRREENAAGIKFSYYPFEVAEPERQLDQNWLPAHQRAQARTYLWLVQEWKDAWKRAPDAGPPDEPAGSDELAESPEDDTLAEQMNELHRKGAL